MSTIEKKRWRIQSKEGDEIQFFPVFETIEKPEDTSALAGDVECRYIQIKHGDKTITLNYLDLYMFLYFISSEELRVNLSKRYERNVSLIPYEVSFTLDREEMEKGTAKRLIQVPVDEISMVYARSKANEMLNRDIINQDLNPAKYRYKRDKRQ